MFTPFNATVLFIAGFATMTILALATTSNTSAATTPTTEGASANIQHQEQAKVLSFVPICSDAITATSRWEVTNENATAVSFTWNNVENNRTGQVTAVPGTTAFTTYYNVADPNNRTEFVEPNHDVPVSRNAQVAPCQPPAPTCVDGNNLSNLDVKMISKESYSIVTKNDKLLCNDVTVFLSSYTMLDEYNGGGFGAPYSYPQQLFKSVSATLKAGTNGQTILIVALPEACKNIQVDLYYAPEITYVGQNGHGSQFIAGEIYQKTGECQGNGGVNPPVVTPPVVTPPVVTPPVVTPPVVTPPAQEEMGMGNASAIPPVTELPVTGGASSATSMLMTFALGLMTYGSVYFLMNRKQN